ncbi:hypothetical protein L2764_27335 [Shewanella surugensis]|uniref:Jacalin-type lectin domain-containing protein n=1 Tax=Shewanella surugensis TaxID=212020 RepID=A0ABT0LKB2_9GAMM|nr:hypothetical protein [Shewanella surugensis]
MDSITISTNYGQTLTKGGGGGPAQFSYTTSDEFQIAGFKGRSGSIIDAIGVIYHRYY